jgi:hypothetical protein
MTTHDWFNGLGRLICVVEWDCADVVVKDVGLNDAVEKSATNETEFSIYSCSGSTNIIPGFSCVVGERGVRMLKVGDGNYNR